MNNFDDASWRTAYRMGDAACRAAMLEIAKVLRDLDIPCGYFLGAVLGIASAAAHAAIPLTERGDPAEFERLFLATLRGTLRQTGKPVYEDGLPPPAARGGLH